MSGPGAPASEAAAGRERLGWYFYDWANSAFTTSVVTVFCGPYLTSIARAAADSAGYVYPLGIPVVAGAFFPFAVSLSVILQVLAMPIVGGIADSTQRKKLLLGLSAYVGAFATLGLYAVQGTAYLLGGGLFVLANLAFGISIVIYNSFLAEIAPADARDHVSSRGWAFGYLGGGLLLAANVVLFSRAADLGLSTGEAVRICLASAGGWWAFFTLVPLGLLRSRRPAHLPPGGTAQGAGVLVLGFRQLFRTLREARRYPQTLLFLFAFLLYNDGIQTVVALATQFGQEELGIPVATLTTVILMVQFVAFFGALAWGVLARRWGARRCVIATLAIWSATLGYAYLFLHDTTQFFVLAAIIGLVLGGSQALSRSLYSLMIPAGREAEYFSLYEVSDRGTSWLGPLIFGLALQATGSYRISILSMALFFVAGMLLLTRVDVRRAALEAGNRPPERGLSVPAPG